MTDRKVVQPMELTRKDFKERAARVADGTADDEDARLVKHYQRQGFKVEDAEVSDPTPPANPTATSTRKPEPDPEPDDAPPPAGRRGRGK